MKKGSIIFILTIACSVVGILFFLIQRKWLIVQWTFHAEPNEVTLAKKETVLKKELTFYWLKKERVCLEKVTLIWRRDKNADNIKQVVNTWLDYLKAEKNLDQSIAIESVVLSPSEQDAFLSFNQGFSWKEWSVYKKWMLIESLRQTLQSAGLPLKFMTFLVNQEPMLDDHLDFSHPLSIDGFSE